MFVRYLMIIEMNERENVYHSEQKKVNSSLVNNVRSACGDGQVR